MNKPDPILIDAPAVCGLMSIGMTHLHKLRATGRFPIPAIRLGKSVRYNRQQIVQWIEAGCPAQWRVQR